MNEQLMGRLRRRESRRIAVEALLDGWSPAGRLAGLALPDREGLEDLLQLITGALYLDEGRADDLREVWPRMYRIKRAEPRLFEQVAALVQDVRLADQLRQAGAVVAPITRHPSLLDHLLGRVRGAFRPQRFAAQRPVDELALDLERLTMELGGELHRERGWPAGRALLARRVLAHCLVPRADVHLGRERDAGHGDQPRGPAAGSPWVLPTAREVMAVVEPDRRLDLVGQYQGAALALVLPRWLELLTDRGLVGTRETDEAVVDLGELLASRAARTCAWGRYYDPTVLRHLGEAWFWRIREDRQAC